MNDNHNNRIGPDPGTIGVSKRAAEDTVSLKLAHVFQHWSELCRRSMGREISVELQYYMAGRADAHAMDASRARTAASIKDSERLPDELTQFSRAYEIMVKMLGAFSNGEPSAEFQSIEIPDHDPSPSLTDEPEEPFKDHEITTIATSSSALETLRARAARLRESQDPLDLGD